MTCPWCGIEVPLRSLHAHLSDEHGDVVGIVGQDDRQFYEVRCPSCDAGYRKPIKKSGRDPDFLAEFDREVRMVALDMLVNHLLAEHQTAVEG
ncbi:MAG: hypothetical protein HY241_15325 [Actinobacteria bacterium]|nr:hypothetical protein [Actinomycetota bacterium]